LERFFELLVAIYVDIDVKQIVLMKDVKETVGYSADGPTADAN
jgi:hypothetical protein